MISCSLLGKILLAYCCWSGSGELFIVVYSTFILDLLKRTRTWSWSVSPCAGGPFVVCIQPVLSNSHRNVCLQRWVEVWETGEELLNQPFSPQDWQHILTALQNLKMVGSGRRLWRSSPIFPHTNKQTKTNNPQTKRTQNQTPTSKQPKQGEPRASC